MLILAMRSSTAHCLVHRAALLYSRALDRGHDDETRIRSYHSGACRARARSCRTDPRRRPVAYRRSHTAETILRAWLEGKSEHTIRSYQSDLDEFALFLTRALGMRWRLSNTEALSVFFRQAAPSAHEIALGFRNYLAASNRSAATINRHIATLRSVCKLGRQLGMIAWLLEVSGVRAERRRQTAGPTVDDVRRMLEATSGDTEAETRDFAIVTVLYCLGLRVSELCGLNLEDADLERGTAWIRGKGRRERELVPLPVPVMAAIRRYLPHRGMTAGPLFQTRGNRGRSRDGRLETRSVLRLVRVLGQRVGIHAWCHGLRHTSITQAAELGARQGLGLDKIRAHSRHRSIVTLMLYIDQHHQAQTQKILADLVASTLERPETKQESS